MCLILIHNSTITWKHEVKSSLSISPCHDQELTPSTVYTKFSIHYILHTPRQASSQDRLSPSQSLISLQTMLYSTLDILNITSEQVNRISAPVAPPSQTTASSLSTCKCSSNVARSWPPCGCPNSHDQTLQVYHQLPTIPTSKCISILALSRPPSASLNWHNHGFRVHLCWARVHETKSWETYSAYFI